MCLERWPSWSLGFPQSSRPVGGGQTELLTLAGEMQLTAVQRLLTLASGSFLAVQFSSGQQRFVAIRRVPSDTQVGTVG